LANGFGYITWFAALRRLPASLVSIGSLLLVPAVGMLASAAMLEPLGWREGGGIAALNCRGRASAEAASRMGGRTPCANHKNLIVV
jgi:hypothetical protein